MQITLGPEEVRYLQQQIDAGRFASADAAISAAVRLLKGHDEQMQSIRAAVAESRRQAQAGDVLEFSEVTIDSIRAGSERRRSNDNKSRA